MAAKVEISVKQIKVLQTTDLAPMIRMAGMMAPRMLAAFLPKLNQKQRDAFNKVMPVDGKKKLYIHLVGTPTPPIVIQLSQPPQIGIASEGQVKKDGIIGLKLTTSDLQALASQRIVAILWQLKGQAGTLISLSGLFVPFIQLGPAELKDLRDRALLHFKPAIDLLPH